MAAVKVISLTKEYGDGESYIKAVDNVSLTIGKEEFAAVVGASGSGKTTLLNLIGGLEYPTHGVVYVDGVDITQLSAEEQTCFRRQHIGFIFQKYNLIPAMNIFENIVLPAKLMDRKIDKEEVFRLAEDLEIQDKLFQTPDTLSGGQQQRAAIARAIFTRPAILLGDELTGNLDSKTRVSVMKLLKETCRKYRQTLLIVTHDKTVAAMADRIICMKDGRIVENEKYNYDRTAQQVLLDSYRKQNRGKNRLLLLAVTLTVSVIYCILSFAYGKIQTDIQKNIRADGMAVSVYIENGTEEMAEQLKSLPYIAKTGKEKFAGKIIGSKYKILRLRGSR